MTTGTTQSYMNPRLLGRFLLRGAGFAALWWLLALGAAGSWTIGVPAVLAATSLSLALAPEPFPHPRLTHLPGFAFYFLRESVAGGVDVAARALRPAMPLKPGFVTVALDPLTGPQRLVFCVLVSLMPGTLSARLQGDALRVHVIDTDLPVEQSLADLRSRLGTLFGEAGEARPR